MSSSTHRLLTAAQSGDRAALEALFSRLLPRVRKIAALYMGCRESELWSREDLVQETLLDAFLSMDSFVPKHEGALAHWLATLVQNNLMDHHRRRNARKRGEGGIKPETGGSERLLVDSVFGVEKNTPGDYAQAAELELRLEAALLQLGEAKRKVIILRKICGLSFEEIAGDMGFTSASSASALLSRALAELSAKLA